MMELYKHHFNNDDTEIRKKISQVNDLISKHEEEIANPILDYISSREDLSSSSFVAFCLEASASPSVCAMTSAS